MAATILQVLTVILIIAVIVLAVLYFLGRKLEKRQVEQQAMLEAAKQTVSMLVIDKKKMKIRDAGLPKMVYEQTPKYMRWAKVPVVKAKVGPRVMTLMADERTAAGEGGSQGCDQRDLHNRHQERPRRFGCAAAEEERAFRTVQKG